MLLQKQKTTEILDKNVTPALKKIEDHLRTTGNEFLVGKVRTIIENAFQ